MERAVRAEAEENSAWRHQVPPEAACDSEGPKESREAKKAASEEKKAAAPSRQMGLKEARAKRVKFGELLFDSPRAEAPGSDTTQQKQFAAATGSNREKLQRAERLERAKGN